jgi:hypothetical protein
MSDPTNQRARRRKEPGAATTAPDAEPVRVIVTKHRTYRLAASEQGIAAKDYFSGVELPKPLKDRGA